jgi:uncharacterized cupredoxin-like copper-binding protein
MLKLHITGLPILAICAGLMTTAANADALVNVQLSDTGVTTDLSKSMELGMGMKGDMTKAIMGIQINPKSVLHGTVKFYVTNKSHNVIHEMILSPVADEAKLLAYTDKENRVDEETAIHIGEVSELDPGKSGTLIVDVKPGKYILYCNLPGHYMAGMWTLLEVR